MAFDDTCKHFRPLDTCPKCQLGLAVRRAERAEINKPLRSYSIRELLKEALRRLDPINQEHLRSKIAAYLRGD